MADRLGKVAAVYPWSWESSDEGLLPVDDRSAAAVEALGAAREAEAAGLRALAQIAQAL